VWTEDALERAKARSANEADHLNSADEHLSGAREAYLYETRQAQLKSFENEIASLRSRREYLLNRTSAAERGMSSFREQYTRLSREQVEGLSRVVNPLFGRMHANRIFDGIKLGDDEDFLRWVAGAGEQFFDPEIDFGQGQRQDLALSLFLARALSIGGTFFLGVRPRNITG
jgi:exonuclease SbcC